ncbi:MAG TPA: hypothetical protein VFR93_09765, partial [Candidatus Limnocylindrales bacterium]|nr:hypothetical protein [Candidatus Limnocylindrales bacterium]
LDDAIATLRRLGLTVGLALALMDRVVALPDAEGRGEAEAEARTILERLGARGLLERFDGLVAGADRRGGASARRHPVAGSGSRLGSG